MKKKSPKKVLKKIARVHTIFSVGLFSLYVALAAIYSPEFLLSDVRHKFQALADDTITILATVLGPPEKPLVVGSAICLDGNLSINLDWPNDQNSESFDVSRNGLPLVASLSNSQYSDTVVTVGTSYTYVVTARGEMSPGSAESDPLVITTLVKCEGAPLKNYIKVISFDFRNINSYGRIVTITERRPLFSGTTDIPNANITLEVHSDAIIAAHINANANGYWRWQAPVNISPGKHTLFVSANDPLGIFSDASTTFTFIIKEEKEEQNEKEKKKKISSTEPIVPTYPSKIPGIQYSGGIEQIPLDFSLTISPQSVYQGKDIGTLIRIERLDPQYEGVGAIVRYRVFDEKGNQKINILADAVLHSHGSIARGILIPTYYKNGKYKIQAEIIIDKYNVSREKSFIVMPLPVLNLGGGFMITYPELLSRLGTVSFWLSLCLIVWLLFFSREYWLYLHALRHITERNLARIGLFGIIGGKGVSR